MEDFVVGDDLVGHGAAADTATHATVMQHTVRQRRDELVVHGAAANTATH